jgi:hypothetical protein
MELNTAFSIFNKLKCDNLSLLYNGSFSDSITLKFIELSEYNLNTNVNLSKIRNRVSFLMAECFQNIVRHGEGSKVEGSKEDLPGFFSTKNTGNTYFITSGNLIDKKNIEKLESQLEKVNSLSQEELKELYRKVMGTEGFTERGGAGLGLIEMARKSGYRIEYSFTEFDESFSYFYNQIKLAKIDENVDFKLNEAIDFHQIMNEQNILLIQKGDFSQETILPVLKIIEQNFQKNKGSYKNKAVYHVLVELLQNISKNSFVINHRHEGIFLIEQTDETYSITAGNYIEESKVAALETKLKTVELASSEELEFLYEKALFDEGSDDSLPGLGLIDIAKASKEPIKFIFSEVDEKYKFFSIQVTV